MRRKPLAPANASVFDQAPVDDAAFAMLDATNGAVLVAMAHGARIRRRAVRAFRKLVVRASYAWKSVAPYVAFAGSWRARVYVIPPTTFLAVVGNRIGADRLA